MKYMGSKARIANEILPIILKGRKQNQYYVEPFVGGANMIDKVTGNRIGADSNKYLIAMFDRLINANDFPKTISKEMYDKAKNKEINDDSLIGYIGFMASFRGKFFNGYSGTYNKRNYIDESIRNLQKQREKLLNIKFISGEYSKVYIPKNSIIYCDPPYRGTTQYSVSKNFDHDKFWQWCRDMSVKGHEVFISEYNAPIDFECVWSKEITNSMNTTKTYKPIEKLFKYKSL